MRWHTWWKQCLWSYKWQQEFKWRIAPVATMRQWCGDLLGLTMGRGSIFGSIGLSLLKCNRNTGVQGLGISPCHQVELSYMKHWESPGSPGLDRISKKTNIGQVCWGRKNGGGVPEGPSIRTPVPLDSLPVSGSRSKQEPGSKQEPNKTLSPL